MVVKITETWDSFLDGFPNDKKDIYYTESYVKLYEDKESKAVTIVVEDGSNILLMPILSRKIKGFEAVSDDLYDFESPYGYSGPIANTNDVEWIHRALQEMEKCLREKHYICGFVRFHPLLNNQKYCKDVMQVLYDRQTIAIDTSQTEDEIWKTQIISKNRNMIRQAEKNGLVYKAEYDFSSIGFFIELYNKTMERLSADEFYFFDDIYYKKFVSGLNRQAFLGTVRKDEELICGALFMYSNDYGHYHLEGSNHQYSSLAANNFLLWNTACEMHKMGIKEFHLGGGYDSNPENSLFKFKRAFSNNIKEFYIGKWIFNKEVYEVIRNEWKANNPEKIATYGNRLLCYRY